MISEECEVTHMTSLTHICLLKVRKVM